MKIPNAFEGFARIVEGQVFSAPFFEGDAVLRLAAVGIIGPVGNLHFVEARFEAGDLVEAVEDGAVLQARDRHGDEDAEAADARIGQSPTILCGGQSTEASYPCLR